MRKHLLLSTLFFWGVLTVNAQTTEQDIYLFDDFKDAVINFVSGQKSKEKVNFNFFYNRLCYLDAATDMVMIAKGVENITNIEIDGRLFIIEGKKFIEILNHEPFIQVQYRKSVRKASKVAYGGLSETSSTESFTPYENMWKRNGTDISDLKVGNMEYLYTMVKDKKEYQFRTAKQFQKIYPARQDKIKKYIKENSVKFSKPEQVMDLIEYAEGL